MLQPLHQAIGRWVKVPFEYDSDTQDHVHVNQGPMDRRSKQGESGHLRVEIHYFAVHARLNVCQARVAKAACCQQRHRVSGREELQAVYLVLVYPLEGSMLCDLHIVHRTCWQSLAMQLLLSQNKQ